MFDLSFSRYYATLHYIKERAGVDANSERAMTGSRQENRDLKRGGPELHYCGTFGHIGGAAINGSRPRLVRTSRSDSDCIGLMVNHRMSADLSSRMKVWIVDSE